MKADEFGTPVEICSLAYLSCYCSPNSWVGGGGGVSWGVTQQSEQPHVISGETPIKDYPTESLGVFGRGLPQITGKPSHLQEGCSQFAVHICMLACQSHTCRDKDKENKIVSRGPCIVR